MARTTVSFEWLSSCSGCEMSLVDLHERLLEVLDDIEILRLPILMDTKDYPPAHLGIISGALRTDHDIECAHRMRETCDLILSFGVCAVYGGPQGSCYAHSSKELEQTVYIQNPTTETHFVPDQGLPALLPGVRPLDSEITVDLYLPGCPPSSHYLIAALKRITGGEGSSFGPHNVCFRCHRKMAKTEVTELRRHHQGPFDASRCFLSQGLLCMGSATLDRCLAPCPQRGVPCTGCAGPSEQIILEPHRDVRTEVGDRMSRLTRIPRDQIVREIEKRAKTYYAYAMASPIFREKPTFLLRRWLSKEGG